MKLTEVFQQIILKKWYSTFKDHITLADYEIGNGSSLEMYTFACLLNWETYANVLILQVLRLSGAPGICAGHPGWHLAILPTACGYSIKQKGKYGAWC